MTFFSAVSADVEGKKQYKWNRPTLGPPRRPPVLDVPRDQGALWPALATLLWGASKAWWTGQEKERPPYGGLYMHRVLLGVAASL